MSDEFDGDDSELEECPPAPPDRFALWTGIMHALLFLVVFWSLTYVVPRFERIFKDFDTTLPTMTVVVLELSSYMGNYWFLIAPAWSVGVAAIIAIDRSGARFEARVLSWIAAGLVIGLLMLGVLAMFLPLVELTRKLS